MSRHYPVVIVGGGQAGLAVSHCLKERGIAHRVFEKHRAGHSWRNERWDTFCLVTPNWQCDLPGYPYKGPDPEGFMVREEIVEYLDGYVASFSPPLEEGVEVLSCKPLGSGYILETSAGRVTADQVVVATGGYQVPVVPKMAAALPKDVAQVHSSDYRSPEQLPEGPVLVVGSGQSGCQISEDLHLAGREVHLAIGNAPRCARRYRGKDVVEWLHHMGHYDLPVEKHPAGEQVRDKTNHYVTGRDGGRDIDLRKFAAEGMRLYGPLRDVREGELVFEPRLREYLDGADAVYEGINRSIDAYIARNAIVADAGAPYVPLWEPEVEVTSVGVEKAGIRAVVWCIGFRTTFEWLDVPVLDGRGYPVHARGVTASEGLYFIGLPWLYTWGSGRFSGVGRDARHLADTIESARSARGRPGVPLAFAEESRYS